MAPGDKGKAKDAGTAVPSLPPGVAGLQRGELQLRVDNLRWDLAGGPSNVHARVRWWGEPGDGPVVRLRPSPGGRDGHVLRFPIASGPKPMRRYLKDAATLVLGLEDSRSCAQKGTVSVDVRMLDPQTPITGCYPVVGQNRRALGRVDVRLSVSFDAAVVTSLEMNEYLAATDASLPLYPPPGRTPKVADNAFLEDAESMLAIFKDPRQAERGDLLQILYHLPQARLPGLKPKLEHLKELFSRVDRTSLGSLTPAETKTLIGRLMGQQRAESQPFSRAVAKYILAVLDPSGEADLTLERLQNTFSEASSLKGLFAGGGDIQVADILRRLTESCGERRLELRMAFKHQASQGAGTLGVGELLLVLRGLFAWISRREEWALLGVLFKLDLDNAAQVSFQSLNDALVVLRRADELPETSKENSGAVHRAPPGFAWSGMRLGTSHPASEGASAGSGTRRESPQGRVSSKAEARVQGSPAAATREPRSPLTSVSPQHQQHQQQQQQPRSHWPQQQGSPHQQPQQQTSAGGPWNLQHQNLGGQWRQQRSPPSAPQQKHHQQEEEEEATQDPLRSLISRAEKLRDAMADAVAHSRPLGPPASAPYGSGLTTAPSPWPFYTPYQQQQYPPTPLHSALPWILPTSSPGAPQLSQQHQGPPASETPGGALGLTEPPSPADTEGLQAEVEELLLLQDLFLSERPGGDDPSPREDREGHGPSGSKQEGSGKGGDPGQGFPEQHQEKHQEAAASGEPQAAAAAPRDCRGAEEEDGESKTRPRTRIRLKIRLMGPLTLEDRGIDVVIKAKCGASTSSRFPPRSADPLELEVELTEAKPGPVRLVVELWRQGDAENEGGSGGCDGCGSRIPRRLIGIALVDNEAHGFDEAAHMRQSRAPGEDTDVQLMLSEAAVDVRDILNGAAAGRVLVSSARMLLAAEGDPSGAKDNEGAAEGPELDGSLTRHTFDVTVMSSSGMPSSAEVEFEMGLAPEARFIAYRFPGEDDPLYTREEEPEPEAVYGANARHRILLAAAIHDLSDHLSDGSGCPPELIFEMWDKWPSGEVSRVGAARLPLERITTEHRCGAEGSTRRPDNFRIPLLFDADAPEALLAGSNAPSILVSIDYRAEPAEPGGVGEGEDLGGEDVETKVDGDAAPWEEL